MNTASSGIAAPSRQNARQVGRCVLLVTGAVVSLFVIADFARDLVSQFCERGRVQRAADSAALAAAQALSDRCHPLGQSDEALAASIRKVALTAAANAVAGGPRQFSGSHAVAPVGQVVLGRFDPAPAGQGTFRPDHPARCNAVRVQLQRAPAGPHTDRQYMASLFGSVRSYPAAEATATFCDNPRGFRLEGDRDKCSLLP